MNLRVIRRKAYGKINLSLNITGKKANMHTIDMVVASIDLHDDITVMERYDSLIKVSFVGADLPQDNSVVKAVKLVSDRIGDFGLDVVVNKRLPIAGGLGGSSTDAAATLLCLDQLFDLNKRGVDIEAIASEVGSDVPCLLSGGYRRVKGIGEVVSKIDCNHIYYGVLVTGKGVSSREAYELYDSKGQVSSCPTDNDRLISMLGSMDLPLGNALTPVSSTVDRTIADNMARLRKHSNLVNMTGSGSSVYALFDNERLARLVADDVGGICIKVGI